MTCAAQERGQLEKDLTAEVEAKLADQGRVLLRPSGTEPLIRVMVEGRDERQVDEHAHYIADAVREALAGPKVKGRAA